MRTALAVATLLLSGSPCAAQSSDAAPGAEAVAWLAGCWSAASAGGVDEEVWMQPAGGVMVGMARSVRDGTVRGWEFLLLHRLGGELTYSAQPSGQALAHFRASRVEPDRVTFVNPEHDFPQALEYLRTGPDSLTARVYGRLADGTVDGAEPDFVLRYGRGPGC
ncbi:MAG: DUF6265 family protein [Gemmatimonadota bacterium]|jgi:hypothetical protein